MKKSLVCCLMLFSAFFFNNPAVYALDGDYNINSDIEEIMGQGNAADFNGKVKQKGNVDYCLMTPTKQSSLFGTAGVMSAVSAATIASLAVADPYVIKIDNTVYIFVKDNHDNVWNQKDILGYEDEPEDLFASLRKLSTNDPQKVTANDLRKNGVRLVPIQSDGKLIVEDYSKDYDLNSIDYIDLTKLRRIAESSNTGVFGHFKMKMKDKKTLTGFVTFNTDRKLQKLFNK